jgi:hypothetical protein
MDHPEKLAALGTNNTIQDQYKQNKKHKIFQT